MKYSIAKAVVKRHWVIEMLNSSTTPVEIMKLLPLSSKSNLSYSAF